MAHLKLAALQLDLTDGDNLDHVAGEIRAAKRRFPWIDLVVIGELNVFGVNKAHAQPMPGPAEARLASLAKELDIWLVPGSLYERGPDNRIYNTIPVIDPSGEVIARYRKIYPFYPYEAGVTAGEDFVVFDIPGVARIGLSNCYDMWFPETSRTLAWMGAEVILHPGLTNTIDRDVERAIARAAAATNQVYFIDVNAGGRLAFGRSGVYGPGGEILYEAGAGREFMSLDLDLEQVRRVRERGWNGLGQPLKSFRDGPAAFPAYVQGPAASAALKSLGKLELPGTTRTTPPKEPSRANGQEARLETDTATATETRTNNNLGGNHHA